MNSKFNYKMIQTYFSIDSSTQISLVPATEESMLEIVSKINNEDKEDLGLTGVEKNVVNTMFMSDSIKFYMLTFKHDTIGFIGLEYNGSHIEVIYLYILDEHRNKGFAQEIINVLKKISDYVDFYVFKNNTQMTNLLLKLGGTIVKPADIADGEQIIRLEQITKK